MDVHILHSDVNFKPLIGDGFYFRYCYDNLLLVKRDYIKLMEKYSASPEDLQKITELYSQISRGDLKIEKRIVLPRKNATLPDTLPKCFEKPSTNNCNY
jgi:hypothetical protein